MKTRRLSLYNRFVMVYMNEDGMTWDEANKAAYTKLKFWNNLTKEGIEYVLDKLDYKFRDIL